MITNEKQYRATKASIDKFRLALDSISQANDTLPVELVRAQRSAISNQIIELEEDVRFYEDLRAGNISTFEAESLRELPDILIQSRIARGMSQKDLGDFLGVKEQQIQRYEAERYRGASLDRLIEIADALDVRISERGNLLGSTALNSSTADNWQAFPVAEMFKRGWFEDFPGTLAQAKKSLNSLMPNFMQGVGSYPVAAALHKKSVRSSGQVHEAAIAAWEARVRMLAARCPPMVHFNQEIITDQWIEGLVALSREVQGPRLAAIYLQGAGIAFVVERHLPGTLLDGAAMACSQNYAIIAMTLRYDRLDNFWFTLLHEIAHLKMHIGDGGYSAIFDDTDSPAFSDMEVEADQFAQEALISSTKWQLAVSRFSRTEKAVLADAKRFGVSPAVVAGRVRREANDYTLLKNMVGQGKVRHQFDL